MLYFFSTCVIKQLQFFNNILLDVSNSSFCKHNDVPIILECDTSLRYINKKSFTFLYNGLRNRYLGCAGFFFGNSPLIYYDDQIDYLNTIDYLTDPDERNDLLLDIQWCKAFWIKLVALKYPNLPTFFDTDTLKKGYYICKYTLPLSGNPEWDGQLRSFFGIVENNTHNHALQWWLDSNN